MGIAEELREKARSLRRSNDFVCKDFVAIEFGISSPCKSPRRCCDCYADMFERIADRIDAERALPEGIDAERALPEGVEWPRFEDGEPVKVGDEVEFEGETMRVHLATFDADGWALWCSREGIDGRLSGAYGERVKRPAPEVLDADGVPIKVGDTVWATYNGCEHLVMAACSDGSFHPNMVKDDGCMVEYDEGGWDFAKNVTHERPDSWERIEEDAKLAPRDYLEKRGMNPEKTERIASMMADLVRRAKALAKAGEQR